MRFPVFPPAGATGAAGASLSNTIYPALAAQQLEQDQEERPRLQVELDLRAEERARFAVHQSIADSFRARAQPGIVIIMV